MDLPLFRLKAAFAMCHFVTDVQYVPIVRWEGTLQSMVGEDAQRLPLPHMTLAVFHLCFTARLQRSHLFGSYNKGRRFLELIIFF